MALGTTRIAEKSLGTREIRGTAHGITASVDRFEDVYGRIEWTVAVVCNGYADYSKRFTTRSEALATYETL